jgi:hypothetical protein
MPKRNKVRYVAKPIKRIEILLTGRVWLQFFDEAISEKAAKGDVVFYAHYTSHNAPVDGGYDETGYVGYLKLDVLDGKKWCPILVTEIFEDSEHHFSKREKAYDTFLLCKERIEALQGRVLLRTYREHYALDT